MIPPVAAATISSAFSAASRFSILAISGMLEPSERSRSATGSRSAAEETKETASRSMPCLHRELDPAEVAVGRRRPGRDAGHVHALVGGQRPPHLHLALDPVGLGVAHPKADRPVGQVDQLVLAQGGDARPGDRDRLAVPLHRPRRQGHVHARLQLGDVAAQLADRSFGPGRSPSTATSRPTRSAAPRIESIVPGVALRVGMGEVEAQDVGAGLDQPLQRAPSQLAGRRWR